MANIFSFKECIYIFLCCFVSFIFTYHRQSLQDLSVQHVEGCQNQSLMRKSSPSSQAACQGLLVVLLCLTSFRKCGCRWFRFEPQRRPTNLPRPTRTSNTATLCTVRSHVPTAQGWIYHRDQPCNLCLFFFGHSSSKKKHNFPGKRERTPIEY